MYIETGSKNQARDEISKARELDSDLRTEQPSYSRLHKYIVLEIESGQKDEAAKHLDLADQAVMSEMQKEPNKRYQTHLLKNLARHWRDLGRGDKADALESKIAELEKQK